MKKSEHETDFKMISWLKIIQNFSDAGIFSSKNNNFDFKSIFHLLCFTANVGSAIKSDCDYFQINVFFTVVIEFEIFEK